MLSTVISFLDLEEAVHGTILKERRDRAHVKSTREKFKPRDEQRRVELSLYDRPRRSET